MIPTNVFKPSPVLVSVDLVDTWAVPSALRQYRQKSRTMSAHLSPCHSECHNAAHNIEHLSHL